MVTDTIICGDAWESAKLLADESLNCIVTSPPYWGLRDYGCEGQFGLEKTPDEYISHLVSLFTLLRPKLRKDGTLFVNLGDSYSAQRWTSDSPQKMNDYKDTHRGIAPIKISGIPDKNLVLIPFRFALAMQAAGWWIRNVIIWSKPNPMPESVTDRCTTAHEYIFFMTRSAKYWCDMDAVRKTSIDPESYEGIRPRNTPLMASHDKKNFKKAGSIQDDGTMRSGQTYPKRNLRSVWTITTQSYSEAHFATYPEKLPETCILMGCPEKVCAVCGKPWERKVEIIKGDAIPSLSVSSENGNTSKGGAIYHPTIGSNDLGLFPTCTCNGATDSGTVLDPFTGSGTTLAVAKRLRRHYIGFELKPEYVELANRRVAQCQVPMF